MIKFLRECSGGDFIILGAFFLFLCCCVALPITFIQEKSQDQAMINSGNIKVEIYIDGKETIKGFIAKDDFYNYSNKTTITVKDNDNIEQAIVKTKSIKAIEKYSRQF